jgi:hypothetical protein
MLSEPKTEAARQAREQFERRVEEQTEKEQEIAFSILVWGASPDRDIPIARKRIDIGNQLTQDGHNAMFSEDLTNLGQGLGLSEASREFAQANAADFLIVLIEDSPGALAEVCDLCAHPDIAPKVYVMVLDSYKAGYAGQGALRELDEGYGSVHWYRQEDVESCDVLTKACARVQARRSVVHRHQSRRTN